LQKDVQIMSDPAGQPWNGVYNGFSAAPPQGPAPRRLTIPKPVTIGVGVGGALALGLLVGLFAKPDLGPSGPAAPMRAVTPASGTMPVVVSAVTPAAPVPKSSGKLEVLPPQMVAAANSAPSVAAPRQPPVISVSDTPRSTRGDPACAGAQGLAAQMVCADADLAGADREMNRAYRRALQAGVSPDQLRAEQRDWLAARETAARHSPRTVADLYDQRIDELNQLADEGPG
jgi:uncharacterized protein YecT (DUF1311 family)